MAAQGREPTSQWLACEGIPAPALRSAKSVLAKGNWVLISEGESLTRVQAAGEVTYQTTKYGDRIVVNPDPASANGEWHAFISSTRAVWFLRDASHVHALPIARRFKKINVNEEGFAHELPPASSLRIGVDSLQSTESTQPTTLIPEAIREEDSTDSVIVSTWLSFRAMSAAVSTSMAFLFCSRYRWWDIPILFSTSTGFSDMG